MKPLGKANHHFWRVQKMARATGIDLVAAVRSGELSPQDWADMVQSCRACDWAEQCRHRLKNGQSLGHVPAECANCDWFEALENAQQKEK